MLKLFLLTVSSLIFLADALHIDKDLPRSRAIPHLPRHLSSIGRGKQRGYNNFLDYPDSSVEDHWPPYYPDSSVENLHSRDYSNLFDLGNEKYPGRQNIYRVHGPRNVQHKRVVEELKRLERSGDVEKPLELSDLRVGISLEKLIESRPQFANLRVAQAFTKTNAKDAPVGQVILKVALGECAKEGVSKENPCQLEKVREGGVYNATVVFENLVHYFIGSQYLLDLKRIG